MQTITQILSERLPSGFDSRETYTITLSPGIVRYLKSGDFFHSEVEDTIACIAKLSENPKVKSPSQFYEPGLGIVSFQEIDGLIENHTWDNKLRVHHVFGQLFLKQGMPWEVYRRFHEHLKLKELMTDKCLDSWVKEATRNPDILESFRESPRHLIVDKCSFLKTPFVIGQMALLATEEQRESKRLAKEAARQSAIQLKDEETRRASEDLERLRKSNYQTFVYVMEDVRNGHFKIGRSKTPGKRERTLQSEVPSVTLRFSIPSDEEHERLLHDHFDKKNLRGEWFSLTAEELLWIVSFLKTNGDAARASVDYEWLGKLYFQAATKKEGHDD